MALLKSSAEDDRYALAIRRAVAWLNENRSGHGSFGTTQATILSLKALIAYADYSRQTRTGGTVIVSVNGQEVARAAFAKGHREAIEFTDLN